MSPALILDFSSCAISCTVPTPALTKAAESSRSWVWVCSRVAGPGWGVPPRNEKPSPLELDTSLPFAVTRCSRNVQTAVVPGSVPSVRQVSSDWATPMWIPPTWRS